MNLQTKKCLTPVLLALALLFGNASMHAADTNDNFENYLQLLLSEFNSSKVQLLNQVLDLSDEEAEAFWPIYRDYEAKLSKIARKRAYAIEEYAHASNAGTFDEASATILAKKYFELQNARMDLLKEYHAKMEMGLSPMKAAQFLQVEHQIFLFIDLSIASELPPIGAE